MVTNNALHSLFESVTILVGANQEKIFESNRPQKAFIRQMMTMETVNSVDLKSQGFDEDIKKKDKDDYESMLTKAGWYSGSTQIEFCGPTLLDLFQTQGYLPPNTPMQIVYRMAPAHQYLVVKTSDLESLKNARFKIDETCLFIPVVKLNPTLEPYMQSLTDKSPARFRFEAIDCRQYTIGADIQHKVINRVYNGKVPTRFLLAVYDQSTFLGELTTNNLFTSTDASVEYVRIYVNGSLVREIEADFENNLYRLAHRSCLDWFNAKQKNHILSYENYKSGYTYFPVDLMEGCEEGKCTPNLLQSGFVDIEIKFQNKLTEPSVLMCFGISPDTLDIDNKGSCRLARTVQ